MYIPTYSDECVLEHHKTHPHPTHHAFLSKEQELKMAISYGTYIPHTHTHTHTHTSFELSPQTLMDPASTLKKSNCIVQITTLERRPYVI